MQDLHSRPGNRNEDPIAVLGAGITGLVVAWHLHATGRPVILIEASARAGGAIRSERIGEWLHETGPNTLFESNPAVSAFVDSFGLAPRRRTPPAAAARRYLVNRGTLHPLPGSPLQFARSSLFTLKGKLALFAEPFRSRATADESVASFVERRLGHEFLDRIVDPFVAGIFAGDAAQLSIRSAFPRLYALERDHGSLVRGSIAKRLFRSGPKGRMVSFPEGLEELPSAIAGRLGPCLHLRTRVVALRPASSGWQIVVETDGVRASLRASAVISSLPAWALATLPIGESDGRNALGALQAIPHPPVSSVFLGYHRNDVDHPLDGFGFLTPKRESRKILGTLFSSTLFKERAPMKHVALTSFVGGTRNPELATLPSDELVRLVDAELAELLGVHARPKFINVQRWPAAIPQYNLGHEQIEARCRQMEAAHPGLMIGGNFTGGPSLSACIESGVRLAQRALAVATARSLPPS